MLPMSSPLPDDPGVAGRHSVTVVASEQSRDDADSTLPAPGSVDPQHDAPPIPGECSRDLPGGHAYDRKASELPPWWWGPE
jgi:hypothetical protein